MESQETNPSLAALAPEVAAISTRLEVLNETTLTAVKGKSRLVIPYLRREGVIIFRGDIWRVGDDDIKSGRFAGKGFKKVPLNKMDAAFNIVFFGVDPCNVQG